MGIAVRIGTYHQGEQTVTRQPGYYAADWETLELTPGDYELRLTFETGYLIPMPYWLLVGVDATRIDGRTYNGFGGNNFSSNEMKKGEAVTFTRQMYTYSLTGLIEKGVVTLDEGWDWLLTERVGGGPQTWDEVQALKEAAEA